MSTQEIKIKAIQTLPRFLYHLVPEEFFDKFINTKGSYDCRNKKEWGKSFPFIHTSPTTKQLKERVADISWSNYPLEEKFLLLKIDSRKIKAKFTYAIIEGYIYHHIWGELPRNSFRTIKVVRSQKGKFLI